MMRIANVSFMFYAHTGALQSRQAHTTSYHLLCKPDVTFVVARYRDDMRYGVQVYFVQRGFLRDEALQAALSYSIGRDHDVRHRCIISRAQDGRLNWGKNHLEWAPELCSQIDDIFQNGWERK